MIRPRTKRPTGNEMKALCSAELLAVDIETKDPELKTKGPGTHRGEGFICGMSAGVRIKGEELAFYFPIKHPDLSSHAIAKNHKYIDALLASNTEKVGTNLMYDLEWLEHEGHAINKTKLHDISYAEPILDEYRRSFSLASLAKKYTRGVKKTNILEEYNTHMGWKGKGIENIWRMPSTVAEEYAIADVTLPLEIFMRQKLALEEQNLWEIYTLETELIPLMLKMRKNGVRLDMPLLKTTIQEVTEKHFNLKEQLLNWAGYEFNPSASGQLAKVLDNKNIRYPRNEPTPLMKEKGKPGNPNLNKEALTKMSKTHPVCDTVLQYRHFDTLINMFLAPYLDLQVDGRLYCSFHPLRSGDYGTVSGRLSSSKPNVQQVSAKEEEGEDGENLASLKGQIIRSLFIPEYDHRWAKLDYSQIEYRIMAHYASGAGAKALKEQYIKDKATDFHQLIQDTTGFDRRTAKRLNFGGAYGMGVQTTARTFGWSMLEAEEFMKTYHNTAPYIKETRNAVSKTAARRGFIFTILGRKARTHSSRKLHSMFNRLIQGSAADVMKKGMVDADKAGIFESVVAHLTVHDEMDVSYKGKEGEEAILELKNIMENAVPFDVPLLVDCHTGENWAEAD